MSDEEEDPYPLRRVEAKKDEDVKIPKELSPNPPPKVIVCFFVERPSEYGSIEEAEEPPGYPSVKEKKNDEDWEHGSIASDDDEDKDDREVNDAKKLEIPSENSKSVVNEDQSRAIVTNAFPIPPMKVEIYEDSTIQECRLIIRKALASWPDLANVSLKDACMTTGRNKWSDLTPFATVISYVGETKPITMGPIRIEFDVAHVGKYAYYVKLRGVLRLNFDAREDNADHAKDTPAVRRVLRQLASEPRDRFIEKLQIEQEEEDDDDEDEDEGQRLTEDIYDSDEEKSKSGGLLSALKLR